MSQLFWFPCSCWHPFNVVSVHTVSGVSYGAEVLAVVGVPTVADVPAIASGPDIAGDFTPASLSTDTGALMNSRSKHFASHNNNLKGAAWLCG
jgi:hypothetical protein